MWPYGVNDSRSRDFKIRNRSGQVIYDWTDVHVNTLRDLARAGDYFSEAGAPAATKAIGNKRLDILMVKDQQNPWCIKSLYFYWCWRCKLYDFI